MVNGKSQEASIAPKSSIPAIFLMALGTIMMFSATPDFGDTFTGTAGVFAGMVLSSVVAFLPISG